MSNMFLNIVSTFKGTGVSAATKELGQFGRATAGLGGTLGKVGAAIASFGLAAKGVQFTKQSIDSARDLERNLFSVKTVFDDFAPAIEKFTLNSANMGLSQKDAAKASVFLGSVLKQSGFAMDDVTMQTQKLVNLGADLSATYGYDVQEALLGMTALFRGEYDPIEKFGVAMKQSEINSELAARGQDKLQGAARRNAEQIIRLELLYQRAADAIGAFKAQSGNLYVEQKKLTAQFENMKATVGAQLLPAIGDLVQALKPLVEELTPRLVQVVSDAKPALETLTQLLKDIGDQSTTTGATVGFLADSFGAAFSLLSNNFGVLLQLSALLATVTLALKGFAIASAFVAANPIATIVLVTGAAFLLAADSARRLTDNTNLAGASLKAFNGIGDKTAKTGVFMGGKFGKLALNFTEASEEAKRLSREVANADKAKLDNLKQQIYGIQISAGEAANELRRMAEQAGVKIGKDGKAVTETATTEATTGGASKSLTGLPALIAEAKKDARVAKKETRLIAGGLSQAVAEWVTSSSTPIKTANQALKGLEKNQTKTVKRLTNLYNGSAAGQQAAAQAAAEASQAAAQAAAEFARVQAEAAAAEAAALAERERVYNSFLDSVKNTFAGIKNAILGAFDITGLGSSTNSILRNMEKMLVKLRSFSASVKQLATMGLDPALLQQIISMGPMAGATLASRLVQGGAGALSAINAGFGEFGSLAGEIATTGTESLFNRESQKTQFTINVSGGVGSGATIGKAIVDAIKDYERTSGAVWQGA
jgi:hypothetical protein